MTAEEIEQVVRANIGKGVCVVDVDGATQTLFVHSVDDEGFVCDVTSEMSQPPACAYWVRFTDLREAYPS